MKIKIQKLFVLVTVFLGLTMNTASAIEIKIPDIELEGSYEEQDTNQSHSQSETVTTTTYTPIPDTSDYVVAKKTSSSSQHSSDNTSEAKRKLTLKFSTDTFINGEKGSMPLEGIIELELGSDSKLSLTELRTALRRVFNSDSYQEYDSGMDTYLDVIPLYHYNMDEVGDSIQAAGMFGLGVRKAGRIGAVGLTAEAEASIGFSFANAIRTKLGSQLGNFRVEFTRLEVEKKSDQQVVDFDNGIHGDYSIHRRLSGTDLNLIYAATSNLQVGMGMNKTVQRVKYHQEIESGSVPFEYVWTSTRSNKFLEQNGVKIFLQYTFGPGVSAASGS